MLRVGVATPTAASAWNRITRYDAGEAADGLPPGEGAFIACSLWYDDALILAGRRKAARQMLRNDIGLLAEEYDPVAKRQLGNFPQAFSHVGACKHST